VDYSSIFDAGLGILFAVISWILKEKSNEIQRLSILLNRTREEIAKEYVTKQEVHTDINRVLARLELIDSKLDRFVERYGRDKD
jgi:predicted DNA-binding protein YlxM (UPF0122 family)